MLQGHGQRLNCCRLRPVCLQQQQQQQQQQFCKQAAAWALSGRSSEFQQQLY
jgi:hypothetical protein